VAHAHGNGALDASLNRTAFAATWHCLTGCAIGEVLGLVIATALGWGNIASFAIAIALAFFFGYLLTLRPLVRGGVPLRQAGRVPLAADTVSIALMEIVDNGFVLLVLGAMAAGLGDFLFWWSLAVGLFIAFWAAFPVNRVLIARGRGHAVVHEYR
jgi:Zn-dependent protease